MSSAKFEKAVSIIGNLPKDGPVEPTAEDKLTFYKYYKQATEGDVNTTRPGIMDFTGKAKWDAWNSVKGLSKEVAQEKYVEAFVAVFGKAGNEQANKYIAEVEAAQA